MQADGPEERDALLRDLLEDSDRIGRLRACEQEIRRLGALLGEVREHAARVENENRQLKEQTRMLQERLLTLQLTPRPSRPPGS